MKTPLYKYYDQLIKKLGPQNWWPAETDFEVIIGAVLTQNTNWKNVEKAIGNLKKYNLLDPLKLLQIDSETLGELIKPSGYFNIKSKRLKNFLRWFNENYSLDIDKLKSQPLDNLREEILSISGIGKETADSILLYALSKLTFVVDAYTYRILTRHELVPYEIDYDGLKNEIESELPKDLKIYNEFHALLVNVGKNFCKKSEALCDKCPLNKFLEGKSPAI
ncbi:MAG: endonuclease III domain-containing protein [Planctomycetes bacterium]|nr:endonuclease III domain-containing protein [Planctomycetota bacterium]